MLQTLFGWPVISVIVGLGIGAALNVLSMTPPRFRFAEICSCIATLLLVAKVASWILNEGASIAVRTVIAFVIFGALGVGCTEAIRWMEAEIHRSVSESRSHSNNNAQVLTADDIASAVPTRLTGLIPENKDLTIPTFKEKVENVTIYFGGISSSIRITELEAGKVKEPIDFGGYKPVKVYMEEGKLFVDSMIFGGAGEAPIELKHNEFVVRKARWDRNFDSSALEVVNEANVPVFQLIYKTPYRIAVYGIFPSPAGLMLASEDGFIGQASNVPKAFLIKRLFKYPSNEFPGKREEAAKIVPRPQLKKQTLELSEALRQFAADGELQINVLLASANPNKGVELRHLIAKLTAFYEDRFALKCVEIAAELEGAGIDIGRIASDCRMSNGDPRNILSIALKFQDFAEKLH